MSKAILFNAPAKAGKDVAITFLKSEGYPLVIRECKGHLHKLTQLLFRLNEDRYWEIYNDRSVKETPFVDFHIHLDFDDMHRLEEILQYQLVEEWSDTSDRLDGNTSGSLCEVNLSVREAMIYVSEVLCKPLFGKNYFGVARAGSIRHAEVIVDGSTGFVEELPPLIEKLGQENILMIRVHRDGCTYDGDSRSYIPDGVIHNTIDIDNNGSLGGYFNQVEEAVQKFLGVKSE